MNSNFINGLISTVTHWYRRKWFRPVNILLLVLVVMICSGFTVPVSAQYSDPGETEYAIKVGDLTVSRERLESQVEGTFKQWLRKFKRSDKTDTPDLDKIRSEIRRKLARRHINKLIIDYRIEQTDIRAPDTAVQVLWNRAVKRVGSEEKFRQRLKGRGISPDTFLEKIRQRIRKRRYIRQYAKSDTVSNKEIEQFYEDNKDKFQGRPLEKIRPRLKRLLQRRLRRQALSSHLRNVRGEIPIQTTLSDTGILPESGSDSPSRSP